MKTTAKRTSFKEMSDKQKIRSMRGLIQKLKNDCDSVYLERNKLVAHLSKIYPSFLGKHEDTDKTWDTNWMNIVYVQSPAGQLSWHFHKDLLPLFDHLSFKEGNHWDGHTTAEKYDRLLSINK